MADDNEGEDIDFEEMAKRQIMSSLTEDMDKEDLFKLALAQESSDLSTQALVMTLMSDDE